MIKIVAVDMDGTLLNNESKVTEKTVAAVKKYQKLGGHFVINSGRGFQMASAAIRPSGIQCDYICMNGSGIYNNAGECLKIISMEKEAILLILELQKRYRLFVNFVTEIGAVSSSTKAYGEALYRRQAYLLAEMKGRTITEAEAGERFRTVVEAISFEKDIEGMLEEGIVFYKLAIYCENFEDLMTVKEILKADSRFSVSSSFHNNIEVSAAEADKGKMLVAYAKSLGVSMEDVMVIGDSENDLPMLSLPFGKRIAMGNGEDYLKQICTDVTLSNEEDGVAYAIEKWAI